jgi:two-component system CheB/CheR fusion protein
MDAHAMDAEVVPPLSRILPAPRHHAWGEVLELLPDAVFIIAGASDGGRILFFNSHASRMFGYAPGELLNRPIDMLVPRRLQGLHAHHRRTFAEAPKRRNMGRALTIHGRRRDGSEMPIDVMLRPIDHGETLAIVRDITDRKQLDDALTLARDSAVRANEVKSRFLAAASHDLRQPLQTIGSLQVLLARAFHNSADYAAHFALMAEAVRSMEQMLSSLIDINRLEMGAIQPAMRAFPLQEALARLRSEFGYAASAKSLQLDIPDCAEFVHSDPMLLPVVLRNLIGNAIKYTQRGSVRVRIRRDLTHLYLDVIDTGPGIPAAHLPRLYEAFYQIDNPHRDQRRGVGLGLSIVQTICRLLDHSVTIESLVAAGTTFTVRLPVGVAADYRADPAPAPAPAAMPAPAIRTAKILHIEDEPSVAQSMAMLLRLEGYEVIGAASRDEALQHIQIHGVRPDLILSDYQLPMGFSGDEIVAEIAAWLHFKPPTIILSGDIDQKHMQKARLSADRILPKPVDIGLLLSEMDQLIGKRLN